MCVVDFDRPKSEFSEIDEDTGICVHEVWQTHNVCIHTDIVVQWCLYYPNLLVIKWYVLDIICTIQNFINFAPELILQNMTVLVLYHLILHRIDFHMFPFHYPLATMNFMIFMNCIHNIETVGLITTILLDKF